MKCGTYAEFKEAGLNVGVMMPMMSSNVCNSSRF